MIYTREFNDINQEEIISLKDFKQPFPSTPYCFHHLISYLEVKQNKKEELEEEEEKDISNLLILHPYFFFYHK